MSETGEGVPPPSTSIETKSPGFFARIKDNFRKDKTPDEQKSINYIAQRDHIDPEAAAFRYAANNQAGDKNPSAVAVDVGKKYGLGEAEIKTISDQNLTAEDAEMFVSNKATISLLEKQNAEKHAQRMQDFQTGKALGVAPEILDDIQAAKNFDIPETEKGKVLREEKERKQKAQLEMEAEHKKITEFLNEVEITNLGVKKTGEKGEIVIERKIEDEGTDWDIQITIEDDVPEEKRDILFTMDGQERTIQRKYETSRKVNGRKSGYEYFQTTDGHWFTKKIGTGYPLRVVENEEIESWQDIIKPFVKDKEQQVLDKASYYLDFDFSDLEPTVPIKPIDLTTEPTKTGDDTLPTEPETLNEKPVVIKGTVLEKGKSKPWKIQVVFADNIPVESREVIRLPNSGLESVRRTFEITDGKDTYVFYETNDHKIYVKDSIGKFKETSSTMADGLQATAERLFNMQNKPIDLKDEPLVGKEDTGLVTPAELPKAA